ncbi:MAG: hypothetical protein QM718_04385 [Steroidobacteraceae bacterium]
MSRKMIGALAALGCSAGLAHADTAVTENTTVGGTGFFDLTSLDSRDSSDNKTVASGVGVDVSRFYLTATHTFDSIWSANITTDFNYSSTTGETQLFVKKAYLQGKVSDAFFARIGSADLAWIPFVESLYGYRFVEKTVIDRTSFGTSADWGVHAGGKLGDGAFSYAASIVNGRGYKNPTRSNGVDFEARVGFVPLKGLTLGLGAYSGKRGQDYAVVSSTYPEAVRSATRVDAVAAYVNDKFRIGAEYFTASNWNNIVSTTVKDKADGFSAWGSVNFTPTVSAFARYDNDKPNKDTNSDKKEDYYNAGVAFVARKNVNFAVAYKHDEVKDGSVTSTKYDEIGVWASTTF